MEQERGQSEFVYTGTETSLDALEQGMAQAEREQKKNSLWRSIENGKTATLNFTGRVFQREAEYENGKTLKLDFELTEKTLEGKNKLFSVGAKSKVARSIAKNLRAGARTMLLSRDGEGKATTYKVSTPE